MRKEDITNKIRELAREMAKYWRMEIYQYDLFYNTFMKKLQRNLDYEKFEPKSWAIPIPSILDCLEKLKEFPEDNIRLFYDVEPPLWVIFMDEYNPKQLMEESQSLHEALLSMLLELLREGRIKRKSNAG